VQHQLDVTWLIVDDGGYGILREYLTGRVSASPTATELTRPGTSPRWPVPSGVPATVSTVDTPSATDLAAALRTPRPECRGAGPPCSGMFRADPSRRLSRPAAQPLTPGCTDNPARDHREAGAERRLLVDRPVAARSADGVRLLIHPRARPASRSASPGTRAWARGPGAARSRWCRRRAPRTPSGSAGRRGRSWPARAAPAGNSRCAGRARGTGWVPTIRASSGCSTSTRYTARKIAAICSSPPAGCAASGTSILAE